MTSQSPTGVGVRVCILDTGVQGDHEQFTDGAGNSRVIGFTDLVGDYYGVFPTVAYDDISHGTHVAGIIGGDGVPGTVDEPGADPVIAPLAQGVAPGFSLLMAKVLDYRGSGPDSGIITGLEWCVTKMADVVNLSLAIPGSSDGQDAFSLAVNAAVAQNVVVIAAAGNSGDGGETIGSPSAATGAITVGAVAEHAESTLADATSLGVYPPPFTSRGPTVDGRIKPDIAAPGVSILSALTNSISLDPDPIFGGSGGPVDLGCGVGCYTIKSGTSMSSPFVAGAVALLLEANSALTPDGVRAALEGIAQERGEPGKDNVFGHGLIDVAAAVSAVTAVSGASLPATEFPYTAFLRSSVANNGVAQLPITVLDATKPLAITVAIDGKMTRFGWSPDIDVYLLDEFGEPFLMENPLYDWLGGEEFISVPGTSSTCPAGEDCGPVGTQETIHIGPGSPLFDAFWAGLWEPGKFIIELRLWAERPNNGKGGNFSVELSNAYFNGPLTADAGPTRPRPMTAAERRKSPSTAGAPWVT